MVDNEDSAVLITREACEYLRISRPTYVKCLQAGRIKGIKVGKGWRVLKSELDRFLMADTKKTNHSKDSLVKLRESSVSRSIKTDNIDL